jgi:protease secretion system outer membrane protein
MKNLIFKRATCTALVAVACVGNAWSLDLVADFQKAMTYDPAFQTAEAERQANLASASQARAVYLPEGSYNNTRLQTDVTNRQTLTITQPLINLDRMATFRMAAPRQGFAEATFLVKQQDLAARLLKAANAIVLANENLKLNDAKNKALDQQALAAKKKLEVGQGTVTDLRDIEVKAAQGKAQHVAFKTQLQAAAKSYAAITGTMPTIAEFVLPAKHGSIPLKPSEDYVDSALQNNASILVSRFSERVAELDVQRATGALFPTFSATHVNSKAGDKTNAYSGLVVNVPLQAGSYFARQGVEAAYVKAKEARRESEEKARVEVERLREQVATGFELVKIQQDAIAASELSVDANIKSFEGGVRSTIDVLNATQTLFQVKSDYVTAVTSQSESVLSLLSQTSLSPAEALGAAFKYLFAR